MPKSKRPSFSVNLNLLASLTTLPNLITGARIIAAPVVVYAIFAPHPHLAFWVFFIAGLTDWLDGFAARFYNQESAMGQLFDPLADKFLIITVTVALMLCQRMPLWLSVAIISRDILILIGSGFVWLYSLPLPLKPLFIGKLSTFCQIILCLGLLALEILDHPPLVAKSFLTVLFYATLIATVLSGFSYAKVFYHSVRKS